MDLDHADNIVVTAALHAYLAKYVAEFTEASAAGNLDYAKDCNETIRRVIALLARLPPAGHYIPRAH